MDGHLADLGDNATVEEAQSALLARVEESSGLSYAATWTTPKPDWWSADLTVAYVPGLPPNAGQALSTSAGSMTLHPRQPTKSQGLAQRPTNNRVTRSRNMEGRNG
jgi:hypothetical protein